MSRRRIYSTRGRNSISNRNQHSDRTRLNNLLARSVRHRNSHRTASHIAVCIIESFIAAGGTNLFERRSTSSLSMPNGVHCYTEHHSKHIRLFKHLRSPASSIFEQATPARTQINSQADCVRSAGEVEQLQIKLIASYVRVCISITDVLVLHRPTNALQTARNARNVRVLVLARRVVQQSTHRRPFSRVRCTKSCSFIQPSVRHSFQPSNGT